MERPYGINGVKCQQLQLFEIQLLYLQVQGNWETTWSYPKFKISKL